MENIALIPARGGSKRIVEKNVRVLCGHPLIAYSIRNAISSGIFSRVIVSTDDREIAKIAEFYGAEIPELRPGKYATDLSPDIEWVKFAIENWFNSDSNCIVSILRPTSPLRRSETYKDAVEIFLNNSWASSLRAMERVTQHPGKMWRLDHQNHAHPFLPQKNSVLATHSSPTQSLEPIFIQNASLEITTSGSILETNSISGRRVIPYKMPGREGFDLNSEDDWLLLGALIKHTPSLLPDIGLQNDHI